MIVTKNHLSVLAEFFIILRPRSLPSTTADVKTNVGKPAGSRSAADEDGENFRAHPALRSSSGVYAPDRAALLQRARWRNARWASSVRAGSPPHVLSGAAWSARA